ncbi:MAG TPA: cupin domain-containing protein [Holophaga sp.]|nr:cupin domain-containing protein [Holophaga sp.]HPS67464.1 cupin domain-containing protein [Holophaga sp.]
MNPTVNVGAKLTQIRESRQMSIDQLAERSELPADLIRQIEGGDFIPSLTPLIKIGRVLGVRLGTFLDDVEHLGPVVGRKGQLATAVRFAGKSRASSGELDFHALAQGKSGRSMEPFLIDILPGSDTDHPLSTHEGEEFMYVLGGRIEVDYGKDHYILEEGDCIYLDSIVPHHVHAYGEAPARILAVVYAPF